MSVPFGHHGLRSRTGQHRLVQAPAEPLCQASNAARLRGDDSGSPAELKSTERYILSQPWRLIAPSQSLTWADQSSDLKLTCDDSLIGQHVQKKHESAHGFPRRLLLFVFVLCVKHSPARKVWTTFQGLLLFCGALVHVSARRRVSCRPVQADADRG